jgi:glycosyltransferase involved in cell wall biosynthesis
MDYQPAVAQCAGIGRYTRVLASELAKIIDADDKLKLFYCDFKRSADISLLPSRAEVKAFRMLPGAIMQKMWHYLRFPPFNTLAGDADIFHFTNFTTKPVTRGRSVVSIHDMSFVRFPQFAEERNLRYLTKGIRYTVRDADAIITISEFSKSEIEELLPESRGKVFVTHLGISNDFQHSSQDDIAAVREELGLPRPFIMTLGTVEPRKNLEFLVDVFESIAGEGIDLVVAGAPGWKSEAIMERFKKTPFAEQLHYLRFVPDGKLAALYSAASIFVLPSHYEGFGFTPVEAMACGTPVITSNCGSIPEIVGDGAKVIESFDVAEWKSEILNLISDNEQREKMSKLGLKRAEKFRWDITARKTLEIYKKVLEK